MKKTSYFIILISMTLLFTSCDNKRGQENMIDLEKLNYAFHIVAFNFQMIIDGEVITPAAGIAWERSHNFDPSFTDFILVHSQEEAQGFPDSTIVAWPMDEDGWAQAIIDGIHWAVNRTESELMYPRGFGYEMIRDTFSLEDFGLTYPLIVADLVDNWEKINDLWWNGLAQTERQFIPFTRQLGENRNPVND